MPPTLLNPAVVVDAPLAAVRFQQARPFRHVLLERFFDAAFLQRLLAEFPQFERGNARNEAGEIGAKAVVEKIAPLGAAFAELDALIQTPEFLKLVGTITGIDDLRYDPHYFGGGTHENRNGQELDPHVDFNLHPLTGWHRRLNLIVYLNPEWRREWGGNLELHSNPRTPDADEITLIEPCMNRCVIFETTESSWHGFSRIDLDRAAPGLTRRSIALYFYTPTRPQHELADAHSTIYVDRPLPPRFVPGHTLDEADITELKRLFLRRDDHLARIYREVSRLTRDLAQTRERLRMRLLPLVAHYWRRVVSTLAR